MRNRAFISLLTGLVAMTSVGPASLRPKASGTGKPGTTRIVFQVAAIEQTGGDAKVISHSTIGGPPGTDFSVSMQGKSVKMEADFLTDPVLDGQIRLRAKVKVERLYGYSDNKLPIYEEAKLSDDLSMTFDEAARLYPFGQNATDNLWIEITPVRTADPVWDGEGKAMPLTIKPDTITAENPISLRAKKQPHNFIVQATLLEDGVAVASSSAACLLQDPVKFQVTPLTGASSMAPMTVDLNVEEYARDRPADDVTIIFNLYRGVPDPRAVPMASGWEGVGRMGSSLTYDISDVYSGGSGHKMLLDFKIDLAPGEMVD